MISNIGGSFTVDRSGNLVASTLGNRSGTFGVDESGNVAGATIETAAGANLDEVKGVSSAASDVYKRQRLREQQTRH